MVALVAGPRAVCLHISVVPGGAAVTSPGPATALVVPVTTDWSGSPGGPPGGGPGRRGGGGRGGRGGGGRGWWRGQPTGAY